VAATTKIVNYTLYWGEKETNAQSQITHKFCGCFVNETTRAALCALYYIFPALRESFSVCLPHTHKDTCEHLALT